MFNFVQNYKFSTDKIEKKKRIVSYIQTNTVYFCFTVPFKVVDDDFQIFRLQIITGPPQLHSSRRSFRKWPRR